MTHTLLVLVLTLAAILAVILMTAAAKPDTILVERSRLIHADASTVFALLNSFRKWPEWAPQDRDDRSLARTFAGPAEGVGAISEWQGSGASGAGRMEITQSIVDSLLVVQVNFRKPFRAHNINRFTLRRQGEGTYLTWSMQGTNVFAMKLMSVFTNADRMLGRHFEAGLSNLDAAAR